MSTFYNVVTKKVIPHATGDKTLHYKVGVVKITKNNGWFLQLFHLPDVDFQIYPNQHEALPVIEFEGDES